MTAMRQMKGRRWCSSATRSRPQFVEPCETKAFSAKLVGCHVYAAKLHDYRFRQMEYTLPEEYIDEVEFERQRKIHGRTIWS